jgi:hypothetical protein
MVQKDNARDIIAELGARFTDKSTPINTSITTKPKPGATSSTHSSYNKRHIK